MFRRLAFLSLIFVAGFLAMLTHGFHEWSAQAAATCGTHSLSVYAWSEQDEWIGYEADFKCGNLEKADYRVKITLQEDIGGWIQPGCAAGPCITYRPSATSWYAYGTEHSWQGGFTVASNIDNQDFRVRADVIFRNGDPTQTWFSNRQTV